MISLRRLQRRMAAWDRYYAPFERAGIATVTTRGWHRANSALINERAWRRSHRDAVALAKVLGEDHR